MFGFPPILDGNAGIKFTRDADSGFPKPGIREIFYSIKDGNWTDTTVWQTASGRVGLLPSANDDVYVRHTVGANIATSVNNLFVSGRLNFSISIGIQVVNIICTGTIDMTATNITLAISGNNNRIDNFPTPGTNSTVNYNGVGNQDILPLNYRNLNIGTLSVGSGNGIKRLIADTTVLQNMFVNGQSYGTSFTVGEYSGALNVVVDLGAYALTVNGTLQLYTNCVLRKYNSEGLLRIDGNFNIGGTGSFYSMLDFQNEVNVEMRGGLTNQLTNTNTRTGTGTWTFTTNNQSVNLNFSNVFYTNKFTIADGITVSNIGTSAWTLGDTINGLGATARLTMGASSTLNFATLASVPSMTTGTWDFTTNANTIQYNGNYSATIPSYFTNFHSLTIGGTGTKTTSANITTNAAVTVNGFLTLGGNLTIGTNLSVSSNCTLECSTFNLDVIGTTVASFPLGTLSKNGAGSILFRGLVSLNGGLFSLTGNPTVEFRNGLTLNGTDSSNFGNNKISFTTTSQNISLGSTGVTIGADVEIVGNITVTALITSGTGRITLLKSLNGTTAGSTFDNRAELYLASNTTPLPMTTGVFIYLASSASVIGYVMTGNYTLPYTTYNGLVIGGGTGASPSTKTLSGNTIVNNNLSIGGGTTLECSTFDLSITGTTGLSFAAVNTGILSKNAAGTITFGGLVTSSGGRFNFTGNPNVEFKNGLNSSGAGAGTTGTGQWSFTTNSQSLTLGSSTYTFNCSILVSNITLTITTVSSTVTFVGVLNGSTGASTFLMGTSSPTLNYQNTTQPMATGILDTSTNLNTFIYGAGNQDVKGNPTAGQFQQYRNLRFSGSGTTKTLQGNINVQNTYTVDAGVTVNLNGFTKTP